MFLCVCVLRDGVRCVWPYLSVCHYVLTSICLCASCVFCAFICAHYWMLCVSECVLCVLMFVFEELINFLSV